MPWSKDSDGKGFSIEQSELDHLPFQCPGCHSMHAGIRCTKNHYTNGELTHKTAKCVGCGTNLTVFND
jgi:hypothetical protein